MRKKYKKCCKTCINRTRIANKELCMLGKVINDIEADKEKECYKEYKFARRKNE